MSRLHHPVILLLILLITINSRIIHAKDCEGIQEYDITYDFIWDEKSPEYPKDDDPSFSAILAISHTSEYYPLFQMGEPITSAGMKIIEGKLDEIKKDDKEKEEKLVEEINDDELQNKTKDNSVGDIRFSPIPIRRDTDDLTRFQVRIGKLRLYGKGERGDNMISNISTMTKIKPSSDWFIGLTDIDMCDSEKGEWRDSIERNDVEGLDAGVLDGKTYTDNGKEEKDGKVGDITEEKIKDVKYASIKIEKTRGGTPAWKIIVGLIVVLGIIGLAAKFVLPRIWKKNRGGGEQYVGQDDGFVGQDDGFAGGSNAI